MQLEFYKYHGTGNDFILIDNFDGQIHLTSDQIISLCSRKFGIGSDGLILLEKSEIAEYKMNFYNPDASQSLCGNGARCTFQFARDLKIIGEDCQFEAIDGIHLAKLNEDDTISILMNSVSKLELSHKHYYINTGSPHFIEYRNNLTDFDLITTAREIRYNDRFKEKGTNVNFVKEIDSQHVEMRTYERGVENETFSCGTGVTAVALSMGLRHPNSSKINVKTKGGELSVQFKYEKNMFDEIWLNGPVVYVFKGFTTI